MNNCMTNNFGNLLSCNLATKKNNNKYHPAVYDLLCFFDRYIINESEKERKGRSNASMLLRSNHLK